MKTPSRIPIFFCAALSGIEMGALFTWSYFRDPIAHLFPSWSESQLSLVFSLHNVTVVVFALITGILLRYFKPRTMVLTSATALLVGYGLMPLLPLDRPEAAYVMLLICFSLVAASSAGFGGISIPAAYQPWVPDHLGLLTGIMFLVAGASPMLLGYICSFLLPVFGVLTSMRIIGIICFLLILITMPWCKTPGSDVVLPQPRAADRTNTSKRDFIWQEVLKSPVFWFFFLFSATARGVGLILSDLGGTMAIAFGTAALLGLVIAPANGAASVIGGAIQDRFGIEKTLLIGCGLLILCSLLLLAGNASSSAALIVGAIFVGGAGYGISLVMGASGTRILFGDKYYAQNYSFITLSIAPAAGCGYIAGILLDKMSGAYTGVFLFILIISLLSLAFTLLLIRSKKKQPADSGKQESISAK